MRVHSFDIKKVVNKIIIIKMVLFLCLMSDNFLWNCVSFGISYLPLINQVGIVYIFLYFLKHIRTKNMDIILHIN